MKASSRLAAPRAATSAAGAPVARTRPACISEMRSQRAASFMKWVETKIVTPWRAREVDQQLPEARRAPPGRRPRSARRGSAPPARAAPRRPARGAGGCRAAVPRRFASSVPVEAEPRRPARRCAPRLSAGQVEQPRMQVEVLPHRQLAVEREGLRHVADAPPGLRGRARRPGGRTAAPRPSVAGSRPVSIFIVVVLPQPFEPRKPKISPRSIVKLTWSTAVKSPKRRVRPSASIAGAAVAIAARGGMTSRRWPARAPPAAGR